jgi:hypothetical protein
MENILTPAVLISLSVLIVLHVLSMALRGTAARLIAYLNIALHVCLLFVLSYLKLKIEEAVLVYLISVFAYTVAATVMYKLSVRFAASEPSSDEGSEEVAEV